MEGDGGDYVTQDYEYPQTLSKDLWTKICESITTLSDSFKSLESPKELILGFNGGKDSVVMFHLVRSVFNFVSSEEDKIVTFLKDNGYESSLPDFAHKISSCRYVFFEHKEEEEFKEVLDYCQNFEAEYDLKIEKFEGKIKEDLQYLVENEGATTVIVGNRRTDPYSQDLKAVQDSSEGWPKFLRIHPILNWTYQEIWQFLHFFKFDVCWLYKEGYTSLGLVHKTQKNPYLKIEDSSSDSEKYLPAWHLLDDEKERESRIK